MKQIKCLAILVLLPLAAFARGSDPGNWPVPPAVDTWYLSVVYLVAKSGTGVAIDADTAALPFVSEKACIDYSKKLQTDMDGIVVKYSCQLVKAG